MDGTSFAVCLRQICASAHQQSLETGGVFNIDHTALVNTNMSMTKVNKSLNDPSEYPPVMPQNSSKNYSLAINDDAFSSSAAEDDNIIAYDRKYSGQKMQNDLLSMHLTGATRPFTPSMASHFSSFAASHLGLDENNAMQFTGTLNGFHNDQYDSFRIPQRFSSKFAHPSASIYPRFTSSPSDFENPMPSDVIHNGQPRQSYSFPMLRNISKAPATHPAVSSDAKFPSTLVKDDGMKQLYDIHSGQLFPSSDFAVGNIARFPAAPHRISTPNSVSYNDNRASNKFTPYFDDSTAPFAGNELQSISVDSKLRCRNELYASTNYNKSAFSPDDYILQDSAFYANLYNNSLIEFQVNSRNWPDYGYPSEPESVVETFHQCMSNIGRSHDTTRQMGCIKGIVPKCYCIKCCHAFNDEQFDSIHGDSHNASHWNNVTFQRRMSSDPENNLVPPDLYSFEKQHLPYLSDEYRASLNDDSWNVSYRSNDVLQGITDAGLVSNFTHNNSHLQKQHTLSPCYEGNSMVHKRNICNSDNLMASSRRWCNAKEFWKSNGQEYGKSVATNCYQTLPCGDSLSYERNCDMFFPVLPHMHNEVNGSSEEIRYSRNCMTAPQCLKEDIKGGKKPSVYLPESDSQPASANNSVEYQSSDNEYGCHQDKLDNSINQSIHGSVSLSNPSIQGPISPHNPWLNESVSPTIEPPARAMYKIPQSATNKSLPVVSRRDEFEFQDANAVKSSFSRTLSAPPCEGKKFSYRSSVFGSPTEVKNGTGTNHAFSMTETVNTVCDAFVGSSKRKRKNIPNESFSDTHRKLSRTTESSSRSSNSKSATDQSNKSNQCKTDHVSKSILNLAQLIEDPDNTDRSANSTETPEDIRIDGDVMSEMSTRNVAAAECVDPESNTGIFAAALPFADSATKVLNSSKPNVENDTGLSSTVNQNIGKSTDSIDITHLGDNITNCNARNLENNCAGALKDRSESAKRCSSGDCRKNQASTSVNSHRWKPATKRSRKKLTVTQRTILEHWYETRKSHPYPNSDTVQYLAEAVGITGSQVTKWLSNKRIREKNTKTMAEIVLYRAELKNRLILQE